MMSQEQLDAMARIVGNIGDAMLLAANYQMELATAQTSALGLCRQAMAENRPLNAMERGRVYAILQVNDQQARGALQERIDAALAALAAASPTADQKKTTPAGMQQGVGKG